MALFPVIRPFLRSARFAVIRTALLVSMLGLMLAAVVLWCVSYRPPYRYVRYLGDARCTFVSIQRGRLEVDVLSDIRTIRMVEDEAIAAGQDSRWSMLEYDGTVPSSEDGAAAEVFPAPEYRRTESRTHVVMPMWICVMLLAASSGVLWRLWRSSVQRWYRHEHDLCMQCGYDLTGRCSIVCPECGSRGMSSGMEIRRKRDEA